MLMRIVLRGDLTNTIAASANFEPFSSSSSSWQPVCSSRHCSRVVEFRFTILHEEHVRNNACVPSSFFGARKLVRNNYTVACVEEEMP